MKNEWLEVENKNHHGIVYATKINGKWARYIQIKDLPGHMNESGYRFIIDIPSKNYHRIMEKFQYYGFGIEYFIDENRQVDFRKNEEFNAIIKVERKRNILIH